MVTLILLTARSPVMASQVVKTSTETVSTTSSSVALDWLSGYTAPPGWSAAPISTLTRGCIGRRST